MRKLLVSVLSTGVLALLAIPALGAGSTKHVLVGDDLSFHPQKLKINKGTKVVWTWGGMRTHNVTVISGPVMFHSHDMMSGKFSHRFGKKGTYKLECTIHSFKMTVHVK